MSELVDSEVKSLIESALDVAIEVISLNRYVCSACALELDNICGMR